MKAVRRKAAEPTPKKSSKAAAREGGGINSDDRGDQGPMENDEEEEDLRAAIANDIDDDDLLNMEIPAMTELVMSADGSGERLMIASIEVENFKSYYGRQVLGPFHHNFSAIIGPNGSGKSNVIDSLLFVFGYRASKIRSKKISVLIHSSAGREDLTSCTVAVNFQKIKDMPDGKYTVVPGSQFKVSRTAYKDNSSKYTYNGKTMQFKDIAKLLRAVGIDLVHNRFLILQGEVEQIAMMKPKAQTENDEGMLEYLEDIIGSSRFKVPIMKLDQKIEELQEERNSQLARVKYAESAKRDAEGPVKETIALLRSANGIALAQNKILAVERVELENDAKSDEEKRNAIVSELNEVLQRQKEVASLLKNRKNELAQLQSNYEHAQKAYDKTKRALDEAGQWEGKRKAEMLRLKDKKKKLADDIIKEQKKIDDLEKVPDKAKAKISEHQEVLAEIEDVIREKTALVDERLSELEKETVDLKSVKKTQEEKLGQLTINEDNASSKLTLAQEELQLLRNEEEKERKKLADLKTALEDSSNSLETKKSDLAKARKALPNVEEELRTRKAEMAATRREEAQSADKVRSLRANFEQKRQTVEAFRSQNKVLSSLMREKNSGAIPGIFGRLGDLGAIDAKYDVAISTTCGALDFFVVDTIETAQQCVKLLQRENLGIASFIALDKQERLRHFMRKPERTPEDAPRMFDLIRVADPKILPAFYYALRDTLVADDITAAMRIGVGGKERRRVVTLKGEVVEPSGTMTGGGRAERRGRIGQSVKVDTTKNAAVEVKKLERDLEEEQERLEETRRKVHQLEARVNSLQGDFDRLRRNVQNLESEVGPLEEKIRGLQQRFEEQKARAKGAVADESAVQRTKQKVTDLEKARDEASAKADEVRERVAEVSAKIQEVYDRVVGPFQKELDDAMLKKETATKGVSKEQSALNNAQRNINKAKARKNDLEADLRDSDADLERLEGDAEKQVEEVERLTGKKAECEAAMKEAETLLKEASGQNEELDSEDTEIKKKLAGLTRSREEQDKAVQHSRSKVADVDHKIGKLHLDFVKCLERLPEELRDAKDDDFSLAEALLAENDFILKLKSGEIMVDGDDDDPVFRCNDMPKFTADEVASFDVQALLFNISNLEKRKSGKNPNTNGLRDFVTKLERYEREMEVLTAISTKRDKHRQLCQKFRRQRMTEFMDGFTKIGVAVKEMYQMITLGGDASLDLVDSLDPFSEGVSFGVRPPKKSWKQISNLSGGEKTLSSLALVFALHHYRPTPLYVMDEIDAALDFKNVSIIGHYVKDRTKNAQFIIISLRNNMFELGDRLIGIYKTFDCTKNVIIDPAATLQKVLRQRKVLRELSRSLTNEQRAILERAKAGDEAAMEELKKMKREVENRPSGKAGAPDATVKPSTSSQASKPPPPEKSGSSTSKGSKLEIPPYKGDRRDWSPGMQERCATLSKHLQREKHLRDPLVPFSVQLPGPSSPPSSSSSSAAHSPQKDLSSASASGTVKKKLISPFKVRKKAAALPRQSPKASIGKLQAHKRSKNRSKNAEVAEPSDESNATDGVSTLNSSADDVLSESAPKKQHIEGGEGGDTTTA